MIYTLTMKDGTKASYHAEAFHNWLRNNGNNVALDFKGRLAQFRTWLDNGSITDWEMD
jgi:hypothetical protein